MSCTLTICDARYCRPIATTVSRGVRSIHIISVEVSFEEVVDMFWVDGFARVVLVIKVTASGTSSRAWTNLRNEGIAWDSVERHLVTLCHFTPAPRRSIGRCW